MKTITIFAGANGHKRRLKMTTKIIKIYLALSALAVLAGLNFFEYKFLFLGGILIGASIAYEIYQKL